MTIQSIQRLRLLLPFRMGSVNAYLLSDGEGFVLVDTGGSNARAALLAGLQGAGCRPGNLHLIALTHGDFDHSGNAACLREAFGAPLAMHAGDAGMVARGDMFAGRRRSNSLLRALVPPFTGFGEAERFTPDLSLQEGEELSAYGLEARVLWLPGHSAGSIGLVTPAGDLLCGDLLDNTRRPGLNSLIDDRAAAQASLARLRGLEVRIVYPGHGDPFDFEWMLMPGPQEPGLAEGGRHG